MRINIALGMTPDWFKYAQTTMSSILDNASDEDKYYFYIMANNFKKDDINSFNKLKKIHPFEIEFITIDDSYFEGAIHDWLGVSSSYRLRLSSLVRENKILYLDSDILVRKNIAELYNHNISDYYLAAIVDKSSSLMKTRINLKPEENFYNGGVQLINLEKFRKDNLEPIIMQKLRESSFYTDQDVINDICRSKILKLPLKYNLMPYNHSYIDDKDEFLDAIKDPTIVHLTLKPWEDNVSAFSDKWWHYKNIVDNL